MNRMEISIAKKYELHFISMRLSDFAIIDSELIEGGSCN